VALLNSPFGERHLPYVCSIANGPQKNEKWIWLNLFTHSDLKFPKKLVKFKKKVGKIGPERM